MDTVLAELKWPTCLVYLDDVVVFSAERLRKLEAVFKAVFRDSPSKFEKLALKTEKCRFACEKLKFLGHIVSGSIVHSDP